MLAVREVADELGKLVVDRDAPAASRARSRISRVCGA